MEGVFPLGYNPPRFRGTPAQRARRAFLAVASDASGRFVPVVQTFRRRIQDEKE
jgi:hypothetical protein